MKQRILQMLASAGRVPQGEISENSRLAEDLLIDSLALLQMVLELETELGKRFDDDSLARVKTVGDVMKLVENGASAEGN